MKFKLIILFLLFGTSYAISQTGNIIGVIADENGFAIPGASVIIEGTNKGTVSNFDGNFTLVEVPEGSTTLLIKYLGYADITQDVEVVSGQTSSLEIILRSRSTELDEVVLQGYAFGNQARALNTQKNKINITNIVSTEQIGKFPDANIGEALRRVPGITMQVDQGEARNIIIRGLAPQLNSVTLNGSRIPSAEGDNRNIQLDLIPSDMIQTMEVSKAVTPDMDGDALGGSVNLITRSSPVGFRLSASLGTGVNFISDKPIYTGNLILGDRSKNDKFGWMVSASFSDNDFGSDNVEAEWDDEFEYNAGDEDNLEEVDVNPYANVFEIRQYLVQRVRRSFSANFDYKFNDNNRVYFKSMYNWRDDRENRFRLEHEILDGEDIEEGDFLVDGSGNLTQFPVEVKRQSKGGIDSGRNKNRRLEDQRMQNYSLSGDHLAGRLQLDWMASYARASEARPNERYLEYESEYGISFNNNERKPLFSPLDEAEADYRIFEFGELTEENQDTYEEDFNFFLNAQLPMSYMNEREGFLKFGARGRFKNKVRDNNFFEYSPLNDDYELLGGIPTKNYSDPDFLAGSQYQIGSFADERFLGSLDLNDRSEFEEEDKPEEYVTGNFDVNEDVYAGYVMHNQSFTDKFSALYGIRVEHTTIESIGNELVFDEDGNVVGTREVRDENDYTNFLPGVHLKYSFSDKTILRFAWTNTLARPNYVDLVPFREINSEDEEIYLGNSELDPTTSMNFDLMAEYYFSSLGIVSGGVFYKSINDFIYTFQFEDDNGFEVYQPFNGDDASVFGAEVSFQKQLTSLPGFLKNLSLYLNYTYIASDANGIRNEDGEEREDLDLPNTAPHMFNGSLGYADGHLALRLSLNYSGAYIDEVGGRAFEDRYYDEQLFLDFNGSYTFKKSWTIFLNLTNITNQPLRYYQGVSSRTMQMEYYDMRLAIGLKYDLFKK
jgi:TonB-dependent receptor